MTKVNLLYGSSKIPLEIPDRNLLGVLDAKPVEGVSNPDKTVLEAILNPIASKQLTEIAQPNQTAAIVVDDHTRGLPCHILINPMVDQLRKAGVK
ncbi:MAG: lactate racemase domain-containing protein, partial [Candidatus Odinarchaeota archaeon]